MINNKNLNKIVAFLIFLSLFTCILIVYLAQLNPIAKVVEYETRLFGDEILSLDIKVDEKDWQRLLDNPTAKEYIPADLVINGETFSSVGLRTKGNSSLSQIAQSKNSNRYSIHFKFNQYQKGQTFYGLDTFCINNLVGDNTYMKDYLAYDIMNYIGVPTPLMNYAKVTVNGEDFGFYLALERYEKAFLDRVYNTSGGQLYNVKIQMGQNDGNFPNENRRQNNGAPNFLSPMNSPIELSNNLELPPGNFNPNNTEQRNIGMPGDNFEQTLDKEERFLQYNTRQNPPAQSWSPEDEQNKNAGGFPRNNDDRAPEGIGNGRGGGSLIYINDNINNYGSIFNNAEFKNNSDKDKERIIAAIKNLNEGTNLEQYFDVDEILRYLAAHTVVVNLDSYSSSMAQNYYIYEHNGKISILPWDYGLSFGGFQGGDAKNTINFPIDTPVSGVNMEDRPLINKLLEVDEYREKYYDYLNQIVNGYFNSGIFAETITALDAKINDYVKNDTTSFTTYDNYTASLPILKELGILRAQSIEGQLKGTIPSTTKEQSINKDSLINGDGINLSVLGGFMGGGGNRNPWADQVNPDDPSRQNTQENHRDPGGFGNFENLPPIPDNIPEGILENRGDRNNFPNQAVPDRQGRLTAQGNIATAGAPDPARMILIAILLVTVVIASYLLSKFKRRY